MNYHIFRFYSLSFRCNGHGSGWGSGCYMELDLFIIFLFSFGFVFDVVIIIPPHTEMSVGLMKRNEICEACFILLCKEFILLLVG